MKITNLQRLDGIAWSAEVNGQSGIVFFATPDFVETLKVGDSAPNCFGRLAEVVRITCRSERISDHARFVHFYTKMENGCISNSALAGELIRCVSPGWKSAEWDAVELAIRERMARPISHTCIDRPNLPCDVPECAANSPRWTPETARARVGGTVGT